ncbi:MAG: hypothetical protein IKL08_05460 [Clostridia bacterium]|nr:hypothetical protein [Clostridia bacterium]
MSTRSTIGIELAKGKYVYIYCHSDGYLTYNGAMLLDHYKDREKIQKLIALGDISVLERKVDPDPKKPHGFRYDNRQEDVVVAYGRDRGETDVNARVGSLLDMCGGWIEYVYVYTLDNKWLYTTTYGDPKLKDVKKDLDKEWKKQGLKHRPKDFYGFMYGDRLEEEKKKQKEEK